MAGERILVIDDSPTILKVVQLVLTKAGFQVATAADGIKIGSIVRSERLAKYNQLLRIAEEVEMR